MPLDTQKILETLLLELRELRASHFKLEVQVSSLQADMIRFETEWRIHHGYDKRADTETQAKLIALETANLEIKKSLSDRLPLPASIAAIITSIATALSQL